MAGVTSGTLVGRSLVGLVATLALLPTACTGSGRDEGAGTEPAGTAPSGAPADVGGTADDPDDPDDPDEGSAADVLPVAASDVSLPAMMRRDYDGGGLRLGPVLARTSGYVRHAASYRSDGRRISGIMNIPRGRGPFPVLVMLHGYIDLSYYVTARG